MIAPHQIISQFSLHKTRSGMFGYHGRLELISQHWVGFTDPFYGQCFTMNETRPLPIRVGDDILRPQSILELRVKMTYVGMERRIWDWRGLEMLLFLGQPKGAYKNAIILRPGAVKPC